MKLFMAECHHDLLISQDQVTTKGTAVGEASTVGSPNQVAHDGGRE